MQKQHTIVAGQVLQYRDKLYAKRHNVPSELKEKWNTLIAEADTLQPNVNPKTHQKSSCFQGTLNDLKSLATALSNLSTEVLN